MSKGNMLLGQARGKVGDLVFARAFGKQIVRAKAQSVANPKTIGQNTQRAILATIAKSAAALTPIVDHSFANITYGAESVRHFRKVNMGLLRQQYLAQGANPINLTAKGGTFVPNALKISEGNLPQFAFDIKNGENPAFPMSTTPLQVGAEGYDVAAFKQSYPYLQGGDQLTLVRVRKSSGSLVDGDAIFAVSYDRIVFAPNAFDVDETVIIDSEGIINTDCLDLTKTTDVNMLTVVESGSGKWLGVFRENDGGNADIYAVGLILSRQVNGVWQRSTQYLNLCEFVDMSDNDNAIASYGATESITSAAEYLNQADESEDASGTKGAYMSISVKEGDGAPSNYFVNAGSVESQTFQGATNTMIAIGAQAFAPTGMRIVTVEIDRPDGSVAAHRASSLNYNVAITSQTAGLWKVIALFNDGTKAVYNMTLAVQG